MSWLVQLCKVWLLAVAIRKLQLYFSTSGISFLPCSNKPWQSTSFQHLPSITTCTITQRSPSVNFCTVWEGPRWRRKRTIHSKEHASYLISSFTITMANPAQFLCLLFCFPFESIGSSTKTGLVVLGGDSAELWTPVVTANFEENKTTNNGSKYSGKEITFDSCTLPPPPSPMYGHSLDLVDNNTIVLVHGDFSYNLNSNGWTKGPNTIYNRWVPRKLFKISLMVTLSDVGTQAQWRAQA